MCTCGENRKDKTPEAKVEVGLHDNKDVSYLCHVT